jgi:hypothetical protein
MISLQQHLTGRRALRALLALVVLMASVVQSTHSCAAGHKFGNRASTEVAHHSGGDVGMAGHSEGANQTDTKIDANHKAKTGSDGLDYCAACQHVMGLIPGLASLPSAGGSPITAGLQSEIAQPRPRRLHRPPIFSLQS